MSIRVRTAYSFRMAVGKAEDVVKRIQELGWKTAPITDTASAFGWVKWAKLCKEAGLKPVFGVELAVTKSIHEKKPSVDYWTFIAKDSLVPIHELIGLATRQFRYQPLLSRDQALARTDVFTIMGHRTKYEEIEARPGLYYALSPSLSRGQFLRAAGHAPVIASDNRYPAEGGQGLYETIGGRLASTQSYPQWILSDGEWKADCARLEPIEGSVLKRAASHRQYIIDHSTATLQMAEMVHPERKSTLRKMCEAGAKVLGCDLKDPIYRARLKKELDLIAEKKFEDYFYLVADLCQWARERMIVGPARGSSCGSLVCYLLRITSVDPIPFGLIFERFIDINRADLPDIDIDFPEHRRAEVFEYVAKKYGAEKVARLGTVAMYQTRSALREAAGALDIAPWLLSPVVDSMIERSSGDSRAMQATEDTLRETDAGKSLLEQYPEIIIASEMEGHPRHAGAHAAGIVITENPVTNYVAVDNRSGTTMCDKKDAEALNLLKVDALGLTQLSIFEHALKLANLPRDHLFTIPHDDIAAINILNDRKYSGIFQFNGLALQMVTDRVEVKELNDIVAITALARPGPYDSGGTNRWIAAKADPKKITYPHPIFAPHLEDTLGVVAYQEQVMMIGREIGGLSWDDVTALRKAMSKSLGAEYFNQYGDRFKAGAMKKGVPAEVLGKVWDDLCLSGDTIIKNPFPTKGHCEEMTLKQLYERGGLEPSGEGGPRRQSILMWDGGRLKPAQNWGVTYSGRKITYRIMTESENVLRATQDHEVLTWNNGWVAVGDLSAGDFVCAEAGSGISPDKIVSIAEWGEEDVYDVHMPAPHHNFLASGIIVHNCAYGAWAFNKCLAEGTEIFVANPTEPVFRKAKIEDLFDLYKTAPGSCPWLLSYGKTGGAHLQPLLHVHRNGVKVCYRYEFLDGTYVECTSDHRFIIDGVWMKAGDAANGSKWTSYSAATTVISKTLMAVVPIGNRMTYDIEMPEIHNFALANGLITHNSHAVAYGLISYYCCWLKAHYPLEFAAATLTYTDNPETQIKLLRELAAEGVDYIPADINHSGKSWTVKKGGGFNHLVGPLSNVVGVGPKLASTVLSARTRGEPLPERARKLFSPPKTKIDSLYPIRDAFERLLPDPAAMNIISKPTPVKDIVMKGREYEVMIFAVVVAIKYINENDPMKVAKRGGRKVTGPTDALNLRFADDQDIVFCKVNRYDFARLGKPILERGKAGKALYAIKGTVPPDFRMISIKAVKYIGDLE